MTLNLIYERNGIQYDWLICKSKESLERWTKFLGKDIKIINVIIKDN